MLHSMYDTILRTVHVPQTSTGNMTALSRSHNRLFEVTAVGLVVQPDDDSKMGLVGPDRSTHEVVCLS